MTVLHRQSPPPVALTIGHRAYTEVRALLMRGAFAPGEAIAVRTELTALFETRLILEGEAAALAARRISTSALRMATATAAQPLTARSFFGTTRPAHLRLLAALRRHDVKAARRSVQEILYSGLDAVPNTDTTV